MSGFVKTEVERAGAGNIVAALGLRDTCTGDTLLASDRARKKSKGSSSKVCTPSLILSSSTNNHHPIPANPI